MKPPIVLVMLGLTAVAAASDWMGVGTINDGAVKVEIDKASIVYGPVIRVWTRYTNLRAYHSMDTGDYSMVVNEFKCATREYRAMEVIIHSKATGTATGTYSQKGDEEWRPVPPDSVNEGIFRVLCEVRPKPKP
jgi:hypothetical protein